MFGPASLTKMDILVNKKELSSRLSLFSFTTYQLRPSAEELWIQLHTPDGLTCLEIIEPVSLAERSDIEALLKESIRR